MWKTSYFKKLREKTNDFCFVFMNECVEPAAQFIEENADRLRLNGISPKITLLIDTYLSSYLVVSYRFVSFRH